MKKITTNNNTKQQKQSLKKLADILSKISGLAEKDEQFNFQLADMNIFAKSIDEIAAEIYEIIE